MEVAAATAGKTLTSEALWSSIDSALGILVAFVGDKVTSIPHVLSKRCTRSTPTWRVLWLGSCPTSPSSSTSPSSTPTLRALLPGTHPYWVEGRCCWRQQPGRTIHTQADYRGCLTHEEAIALALPVLISEPGVDKKTVVDGLA
jgi:hypothetical protein